MGAAEDAGKIGRKGQLQVAGVPCWFDVTIQDVRWAYGQERYVVRPVAGGGTAVVSADKVKLMEGT